MMEKEMNEKYIGLALMDTNNRKWGQGAAQSPFEDGTSPHPLLNPIILEKVFTHALFMADFLSKDNDRDAYLSILRDQRRVCSTWNEEILRVLEWENSLVCRTSSDVRKLLDLSRNPDSPSPFVNFLSLRYNELWKYPGVLELFWESRWNLRILEISIMELSLASFLLLPRVCPDLHILKFTTVDTFPDISWLEPFKDDYWKHPFPFLKEIHFDVSSLSLNAANFLLCLLERTKHSVETVIINSSDNWPSSDEGNMAFAEGLIDNPEISRGLKKLHMEDVNCRSFLQGLRHKTKSPRPCPRSRFMKARLQQSPLTNCFRNLEVLSIVQKCAGSHDPIPPDLLERTVSHIIHALSNTLRKLTIVNSSDVRLFNYPNQTLGKIFLPAGKLDKLEYLCLGNVGIDQVGTSGFTGLYRIFPNLRHFQYWIRIFNDIPDKDKGILFSVLFPSAGMCSSLRDFHIYTKFNFRQHEPVLQNISLSFPNLSSLMLELEGELLPLVVSCFAPLKIVHFTLIYYECAEGTRNFDSAMTGIDPKDCQRLVAKAKPLDILDVGQLDELKTLPGLIDWKYLKRLNISYRHGGTIDPVLVTYCLLPMRGQLKHVELRHFEVKENLLLRLIKKMDFDSLVLGSCKIIPLNEDYPILGYTFPIDQIKKRYKKRDDVEISFVGYDGTVNSENTPFYAKLLHHFYYDNQAFWNGGGGGEDDPDNQDYDEDVYGADDRADDDPDW